MATTPAMTERNGHLTMESNKRKKGQFRDNMKQIDKLNCKMNLTMEMEAKKQRVSHGDCHRWHQLPNELWLQIFQLLPLGDTQQLRLVCKRWNYLLQLPEFQQNCKLVLNKDNLDSMHYYLQSDPSLASRLPCDTFEVNMLEPSGKMENILSKLGPRIRSILLNKSPAFSMLSNNLPALETLMLTHMPTLPEDNPICDIRLDTFSNLRALDIACTDLLPQIKAALVSELTKESTPRMEKLYLELSRELEEPLINVLHCHGPTLRHLEIYLTCTPLVVSKWRPVFCRMEQMNTLAITGMSSYAWLKMVFESLPQKAPLQHLDLSGGLQVEDGLLKSIAYKWFHSLEILELMFCNWVTDEGVRQLGVLRNSLRGLNISHCSKVSTRALLDGLLQQTNYRMEKLMLNDVLDADTEGLCLVAQRLPNLTHLSLENCREAVTDETLSYIFRYQRKLQHLVLDHCMRITDEGLIGFGPDPAGIQNLRGLRSLSLSSCRNLSNRTLAKGLKFLELRKLILGYCHKISSMGIEELVENCPALEELTISSCLMIDDDAMLHIARGLPRLTHLNVSNCINLTIRSIDYIVEYCNPLKDIRMCGIDLLEVNEVQEKFAQVKPKTLVVDS